LCSVSGFQHPHWWEIGIAESEMKLKMAHVCALLSLKLACPGGMW